MTSQASPWDPVLLRRSSPAWVQSAPEQSLAAIPSITTALEDKGWERKTQTNAFVYYLPRRYKVLATAIHQYSS
jgi:hypothetical protein